MSSLSPELLNAILGSQSYRATPATLARHITDGAWHPAKHLMHVSAIVASHLRKKNARIAVSFPPRHGKSELLSVHTPIWALDQNARNRVIMTSYGADLATGFGRDVRDLILGNEHRLKVRLRPDGLQASQFLTTERPGAMFSSGVGGPITGRGADVLLIDDYIKGIKEAESITERDHIWDWFLSVAMTRLEPGGSIVIIATRWHQDDLIGRIKKRVVEGDKDELGELGGMGDWIFIEFPALAEENDILGRQPGEALWPERYPEEHLRSIRKIFGSYLWQALYQQSPIPRSARQVNGSWFPTVDILPARRNLDIVRSWDLASTEDAGDYTAGVLMAFDKVTGIAYILDVIREQLSPGGVEKLVKRTAINDGHEIRIVIEQEVGSAGKSQIEHYVKTVLKGFNVRGKKPTGSKVVRSDLFYAAAEDGRVRLKEGAWQPAYLSEVIEFPDGEFDDQVDATSQAFEFLSAPPKAAGTWGRTGSGLYVPNTEASEILQGVTQDGALKPLAPGSLVSGATWGRS